MPQVHAQEIADSMDTIFIILLAIALLVMMYAITLIHNKLRLIEHDIQNLQNEQNMMSDELEFVAKIKKDEV